MSEQTKTHDQPLVVDQPRITLDVVALVLIFVASVLVHLIRLGDMAMHHDESIHAWVSWRFFTGSGSFTCAAGRVAETYCYDPVYHGPSLYIFTVISYFLFGDGDWQARLPQALAGIGLTLSMLWLRPFLGRNGALIAAAAVTLSPVVLYFTRFARHDGLMILWEALIVIGFFRYLASRERMWLWVLAVGIGLATTTHELYYIIGFLFVWFVGLRAAVENISQRAVNIAMLVLIGIAIFVEVLILSGAWSGDVTESLNAGGMAVAIFFVAGISLVIMQLWQSEPVITPLLQYLWRDARAELYTALAIAGGIFVVFYGNFFTDPRGILDGLYQGLAYWLGSQQTFARGDQPWYYYLMVMGLNEPLALFGSISITIAAVVSAIKRVSSNRTGKPIELNVPFFTTFLIYWFVGALVFFSWAGEKMPWLTIHITLPAILLVIVGTLRVWNGLTRPLGNNGWRIPGAVFLAMLAIGVGLAQISNSSGTTNVQGFIPLVVGIGFLYAIFAMSNKTGYADTSRLALLTLVGLLTAYSIRASWMINYEAPDTPRDPMVYTQTAPDVPRIVKDVRELAVNLTRNQRTNEDVAGGLSMPIIMDVGGESGEGSLAWPFQWYFRDMKRLENRDGRFFEEANPDSFNVPGIETEDPILAPVVLVSKDHVNETARTALEANYVKLYDGQLNWWFPEGEKCNPTSPGYKSFYYSTLNARKASVDCPGLNTSELPSLLAPIVWPLDRSHWGTTWRYLMYRDLPDTLTIGGRAMEGWVRKDLAGGGSVSTGSSIATYKIVAEQIFDVSALGSVRGIAVAPDGSFVVSDTDNHQIVMYNADGTVRKQVGTRGNGNNQFLEPRGVAIGNDGSIYVADTWNARIVKLNSDGTWVKSWGSGDQDFGEGRTASMTDGTVEGNEANPLGFFGPRGVATGPDGNVYIADTGNKRIVVTSPDGQYLYQWGSFGSEPGQFNEPVSVSVDSDGTVAVGDIWNGRVQYFAISADRRINPQPINTWRINGWQAQTYDDPYVAIRGSKVISSVPKKNAISLTGADGVESLRWGGNGTDSASMSNPSGVAFGPEGTVYVVDRANKRIMVFTLP
ncbi:MAG: flippase activity-associated protein Agl23 [Roseiflexaceae bacterium]